MTALLCLVMTTIQQGWQQVEVEDLPILRANFFIASLYVNSLSDGSHFCDYCYWLPSKMANNIVADQRWSPKFICSQTGILSCSEFSNIHLISLHVK